MDHVRPGHIQPALDAMKEKALKPRTIAQALAAVSSAFTMAMRWGLVDVNPVRATEAPTVEDADLRKLSPDELRATERAAEGGPWEIPVLIAATAGLRRGEILGLRWSRVVLDDGTIRVEEALERGDDGFEFVPLKSKRAYRTIPVPARTVARLRQLRVDQNRRRLQAGSSWVDHDLVCERGDGAHVEPSSVTQGVARLAERVNLDGARLHDLRHGWVQALLAKGVRAELVSKLAGHSSVAFTLSVYGMPDDRALDEGREGVEDALG